jgi:MFS family permease
MSAETPVRAVAAVLALLLAGRSSNRATAFVTGVLTGFAVFGARIAVLPAPAWAALLAACLVALVALGAARTWSPIVGDGLTAGALAAGGAACAAAVAGRQLPGWQAPALAAIVLFALSAFSAEATRASAEAGWREGAAWTGAVLAPPLLAAAFVGLFAGVPRRLEPLVVAATLAAGVLVWIPALLAERARVSRELTEEVTLGLLPEEDAVALRLPWTRGFEKRFGHPDERREYVRSALLLAVARHQQRHRSGEAERLRQLEVLTFRTRLRRTQEARAARFHVREPGEFGEAQAPEGPGTR